MKGWTQEHIDRFTRASKAPDMAVAYAMRRHYWMVGIDTGVKTGICVYRRYDQTFDVLETTKIHTAMERVKFYHTTFEVSGVFVRVEDARLRKFIPYQDSEKAERGRREGAGYVKRDAVIWQDFLTDLGVDFEMVAPKDNVTKMSVEAFKAMTGYTGITSQHARDAAALVYGF
jgi:hypothetical protein